MISDMERIEESLKRTKKMCKWVSNVFLALFILFCAACICFIGLFIFDRINFNSLEDIIPRGLATIVLIVDLVILGGVLFLFRNIFKTISKGDSPFTLKQSRQLMILGILFAVDVVLNLMLSPAFSAVSNIGPVDFGYNSFHATPYPVLTINTKSIVGAVVCFALSVVWRYGALLQSETDDLF